MDQEEKTCRIGLFGHYGNNNLGDEAIILAAIQNLRARLPKVELEGLSMNPQNTQQRFAIPSFPIRRKANGLDKGQKTDEKVDIQDKKSDIKGWLSKAKKEILSGIQNSEVVFGVLSLLANAKGEYHFLKKAKQKLQTLDAVMICGSNQFLDNFGGPWGFPYTLLKWVLLAGSTGTKIYIVSVGAGPLSHPISYWMLKRVLRRADYVSYRDYGSKKLIEDNLSTVPAPVYPDLAHSLKTSASNGRSNIKRYRVAINPMPVFDGRYWHTSDLHKYQTYVEHVASFALYLINRGFEVNLYNNHPKDSLVVDDIMDQLRVLNVSHCEKIHVTRNHEVQELIDTIAAADIVVATRFHSTILPLRLEKPVLGICYHRKSKELLTDVGLGQFCVNINNFTAKELCNKFDLLVDNLATTSNDLQKHYSRYANLIDRQWDLLAKRLETH